MGAAAVHTAEACGYVNAGTVEFLFEDGKFHFLEMNTRLQVEHPITEFVTGLDLVEWQLRVAAGEPLAFTQDDVKLEGHAIEARINAEDPTHGRFSPSPGTLTRLRAPGGPGVRLDSGYEAGDTVSQFYDNLVAKLVVWGHDREVARRRMLRSLEEMEICGVASTVPAHLAILAHPDFAEARALHQLGGRTSGPDLARQGRYGRTSDGAGRRRDGGVRAQGAPRDHRRGGRAPLRGQAVGPRPRGDVGGDGRAGTRPAKLRSAMAGTGSGMVTVLMQGTIVKLLVSPGEQVEAGQLFCVLEAMKMENTITAEKSGTVQDVRVSAGDSVGPGDVVAVIVSGHKTRDFAQKERPRMSPTAGTPGTPGAAKDAARRAVEVNRERLVSLSRAIHDEPEVSFEEDKASALVAGAPADADLEVEVGICGLPTAVSARAGSGPISVVVARSMTLWPESAMRAVTT